MERYENFLFVVYSPTILFSISQMKYMLILDTINVLGVERVLQLFNETVSIQENGGELTADGTRRCALNYCFCF